MKFEVPFDAPRNIFQVFAVFPGHYYLLDPGPVSGYHLFLDAAYFQNPATKRDLPRHGHIAAGRNVGQGRDDGCRNSYTGGWPVFVNVPFGDVDMNIQFLIKTFFQAQSLPARTDIGIRGFGRLFHDFTQLACQLDITLTGHQGYFYKQYVSPCFSPGQTGTHTYFIFFLCKCLRETGGAQETADIYNGYTFADLFLFGNVSGQFAADFGQVALQIPDTGLPGITLNHFL